MTFHETASIESGNGWQILYRAFNHLTNRSSIDSELDALTIIVTLRQTINTEAAINIGLEPIEELGYRPADERFV